MATTVIPDRFTGAYNFATAGSITPAVPDSLALFDTSSSDARSTATVDALWFDLIKKSSHLNMVRYFSDCVNNALTQGGNGFTALSGGDASTTHLDNDNQGRVGINRSTTGTSTNSALYVLNQDVIRLGGGKWFLESAIALPTLSTSSERYVIVVGFFDSDQQNFATWLYDEGGVYGNAATYWQTVTVKASTPTRNQNHTQTTVAVDTWYRLGVEVNDNATEVKFYLDGNLQGTHTTNIPKDSGEHITAGTMILKTVGATPRTMDIDYVNACADLTSTR